MTSRTLRGGDGGVVVIGCQAHRVQYRRPRGATRFQRGDDGVRPALDHLRLILAAAVDVAEQPFSAARRVGAQPRADIDAQRDPTVGAAWQLQRGDRELQTLDFDGAGTQTVVQGAVTAAVLRAQRQIDQGNDRTRRAQHRVGQLEQRVRPRRQTVVENFARNASRSPSQTGPASPDTSGYGTLIPTATACVFKVL